MAPHAHTDHISKVFDISIDGISLLRNYRSDFQNHIEVYGINALIEDLENK